MKHCLFALLLSALAVLSTHAAESKLSKAEQEKLASELNYQHGKIVLRDGLATLNIPENFAYLDAKDAQTVLSRLWLNPPDDKVLGMIVPQGFDPLGRSWTVVITYEDSGYVKDDDAGKINYAELLAKMQKSTDEESVERVKEGYPSIKFIGWAETPYYDKANHKLYWAQELEFNGKARHTLNYNIRVLGRRGVLVLNAVAGMSQLDEVKKDMPEVIAMVNFQEGHRYVDFDPKYDKLAGYGLAALIAGGVAAKAGLFKGLIVAVLALKKFIIAGCVGAWAFISKFFKRKKGGGRIT